MLVLRKYQLNEVEEIKEILKNEGIRDLIFEGIIYVVIDNDSLVGVGKAIETNNKWMLKYLVIRKERRNQGFGDALLRAILNKLRNQGISVIFCRLNNPYLIKKGFIVNDEKELELNIENFFSIGCNGCGGCDVL